MARLCFAGLVGWIGCVDRSWGMDRLGWQEFWDG